MLFNKKGLPLEQKKPCRKNAASVAKLKVFALNFLDLCVHVQLNHHKYKHINLNISALPQCVQCKKNRPVTCCIPRFAAIVIKAQKKITLPQKHDFWVNKPKMWGMGGNKHFPPRVEPGVAHHSHPSLGAGAQIAVNITLISRSSPA